MSKIYENQDEHSLKNETEKIEISEKNKKSGEIRKAEMSPETLSIKLKITFWYTGLIIGIAVLFFGTMFYINDYVVRNSVNNRLKKTVERTVANMEFIDGQIILDNNLEATVNEIFISIYDSDKEFIYGDSHLDFEFADAFSNGKSVVRTVQYESSKWYVYEIKKVIEDYGVIYVRGITPASGIEKNLESIMNIFFVVFPFLLVISALGGYLITKKAFEPIEKIRETAEKINEGNDLTKRIDIGKGKDEISVLANTFDKMFDRLQSSFDRETQFTSDVSHELRTPISVISSQSQYGLKYVEINDETREIFENILDESKKMTNLISKLLMLSRMDKGSQKLTIENTDFSEVVEIVVEMKMEKAEEKNITIESDVVENLYADVDKSMITRVFINLIDNAITYGKENGKILIKVFQNKDRIVCKVEDDGIGIAKEHMGKIWNRFYQVDSSRSGDNSGLGLSLVKWIIDAHKGTINVESELGKGTVFTFEFPLKSENSNN